nr:unnamed protein product [Callosobruchus chinensis]
MWLQQDGYKAHYGHAVRECLDDEEGRWRGRSGTISWLACSTDLNPLFIYYWRAVKEKFYLKPIENLNELRHIITEAVEVVNNGRFACLINRPFLRRGRQFEHIL